MITRTLRRLIYCVIVLLLTVGCFDNQSGGAILTTQGISTIISPTKSSKIPLNPQIEVTPTASFSQDELATLASLQQVKDLPFYVMHFFGDYGFKELLGYPSLTEKTVFKSRMWETQPIGITKSPISQSLGVHRAAPAWGCTVFAALDPQGDQLLGRNFDWRVHPTLLLFTDPPDGYASVSMVDADYLGFGQHSDDAPLSDLEKEGLLRAPYMPFDGMNEYGLAVGMMAVPHAEGGDDLRKTTLGDLQVIRLLLDYARTVDEAIGLLKEYNVDFSGGPPVHYLVADRSGAAAVVEYLDGQPHVIRNTQPWLVATNFLLAEEKPVGDSSSCWRYNHVFSTLQTAGGELSSVEALSLLQDVSQGGDFPTIWSVVYNMSDGTIQAVIRKDYGLINIFQLEAAR